jgi:hypothetical protein
MPSSGKSSNVRAFVCDFTRNAKKYDNAEFLFESFSKGKITIVNFKNQTLKKEWNWNLVPTFRIVT